ncbi:unnamed protein product [Merluccius merluccius]
MAPIGSSDTDESVDFARVTAIANKWMLDFTFTTLCRRFKGGEVDAFNRALNTLEAIDEGCKLEHEQSVAVCLEKGKKTMASTALEWLQEKHNLPKNMAIKLTTLVAKGDIYHPFLRSFTYQHLLEKIWAYLDTFLAEVPSDFLFQAAAKVAQSYQRKDSSEEQEESSQSTNKSSPHFEE